MQYSVLTVVSLRIVIIKPVDLPCDHPIKSYFDEIEQKSDCFATLIGLSLVLLLSIFCIKPVLNRRA